MKTKKIVAVQFDPEYQTSPLDMDESLPYNVAVLGNNRMDEHIPERCEKAFAALRNDSFLDDLESPKRSGYPDAAAVMGDWLPRENGAAYNADECRAFVDRIFHEGLSASASALAALMSLVEGKHWKSRTIRGMCQSDWNEIAYPASEWPEKELEYFECEYWNMGCEWDVYPFNPEEWEELKHEGVTRNNVVDVDDCPETIYSHEFGDDKIKTEIAAAFDAAPEDVILLKFDCYVRTSRSMQIEKED